MFDDQTTSFEQPHQSKPGSYKRLEGGARQEWEVVKYWGGEIRGHNAIGGVEGGQGRVRGVRRGEKVDEGAIVGSEDSSWIVWQLLCQDRKY